MSAAPRVCCALVVVVALVGHAGRATATEYTAGPADYRDVVARLQPGDVLTLAPGTYTRTLPITGVNGRADAWITIRGPASGAPAVFTADPGPCCNTVELVDASYLALEHLVIDGGGVAGAFGISAKAGAVHHIRVEACELRGHGATQQTVAISTKVATWGWVIRGNRIRDAGTGLYLGNSDGSAPFVEGVIEHNLVTGTVGYGMQIKFQTARPAGLPPGPTRTLIRHNVFVKDDRPSPDGDRPNLLVGGFPASGAGADDRYEIYGNLLVHNPREALLQASGRVSIHDNVLVDVAGAAIVLADHDRPLVSARVYHNTIFGAGTGVDVASAGDAAAGGVAVAGNLIFAATPIAGATRARVADNQTGAEADAAAVVAAPSRILGAMDFYPRPGQAQGPAIDAAILADDVDARRDFNGADKGGLGFRGAYAGAGANPGWPLAEDVKVLGAGAGDPDGGAGGGEASAGGCGCASGGDAGAVLVLPVVAALARRRRRAAARCAVLVVAVAAGGCGGPAPRAAPPANTTATPTPLAPPPPEPWFHDKPDAYAECAAPPSAAPAVALPAPYERCDGAEEGWASPPGGNELHFHYRAFSAAVTAARRVGDPGVCCYLVWEFPSFRPDDGS